MKKIKNHFTIFQIETFWIGAKVKASERKWSPESCSHYRDDCYLIEDFKQFKKGYGPLCFYDKVLMGD
jgi:hypothetical protein